MSYIHCLLLLVSVALAGCGHNISPVTAHEPVSLFEEDEGVLFSDETIKLFGLEFCTVAEKSLHHRVEKTAQVYRFLSGHRLTAATLFLLSEEAAQWKPGQPASVRSLKDRREFSGKIVAFDHQMESVIGQVEVLIEFPDPERRLAIGDPLSITLTNCEARHALVVPESALLTTADGIFVYITNGQHLARTRVRTGAIADGFVAIEGGVAAGNSVVTKGLNALWLVELSALKGGEPCCPVPHK